MAEEKRFLDVKQFGKLLQISTPTVRRILEDEASRRRFGAKKARGGWRFDARQIDIAMSNAKDEP